MVPLGTRKRKAGEEELRGLAVTADHFWVSWQQREGVEGLPRAGVQRLRI